MTIFEIEEDLIREKKAIDLFVGLFNGTYQKLGSYDIDYKVFKDNSLIAYAEVKGRIRTLDNAYPLPISAHKLIKLIDKGLTSVLIWACEDGIIYGKVNELRGEIKWGGRPPRVGSSNDSEMMVYYSKQDSLKYILFL